MLCSQNAKVNQKNFYSNLQKKKIFFLDDKLHFTKELFKQLPIQDNQQYAFKTAKPLSLNSYIIFKKCLFHKLFYNT